MKRSAMFRKPLAKRLKNAITTSLKEVCHIWIQALIEKVTNTNNFLNGGEIKHSHLRFTCSWLWLPLNEEITQFIFCLIQFGANDTESWSSEWKLKDFPATVDSRLRFSCNFAHRKILNWQKTWTFSSSERSWIYHHSTPRILNVKLVSCRRNNRKYPMTN